MYEFFEFGTQILGACTWVTLTKLDLSLELFPQKIWGHGRHRCFTNLGDSISVWGPKKLGTEVPIDRGMSKIFGRGRGVKFEKGGPGDFLMEQRFGTHFRMAYVRIQVWVN